MTTRTESHQKETVNGCFSDPICHSFSPGDTIYIHLDLYVMWSVFLYYFYEKEQRWLLVLSSDLQDSQMVWFTSDCKNDGTIYIHLYLYHVLCRFLYHFYERGKRSSNGDVGANLQHFHIFCIIVSFLMLHILPVSMTAQSIYIYLHLHLMCPI